MVAARADFSEPDYFNGSQPAPAGAPLWVKMVAGQEDWSEPRYFHGS